MHPIQLFLKNFFEGAYPRIHHSPPPPPPPRSDNDRVCDHNAMLAFPQEKISHYTTGLDR